MTADETPLGVPSDAIDVARELNAHLSRDQIKAAARYIAAPVVAAELRRLADEFARHPDRAIATRLRARAAELDAAR